MAALRDAVEKAGFSAFEEWSSSETPLSQDEATELIRKDPAWRELVDSFQVAEERFVIRAKEHEFCWVLAAHVPGGGIPAGIGFMVDKGSSTVLPRRLVDVLSLDGELI